MRPRLAHVFVVSPTFYPHTGGAQSLFDDLVALLAERGYRVTVLTETPHAGRAVGRRRGAVVLRTAAPPIPRRRRDYPGFLLRTLRHLAWHWWLFRRSRVSTICIARLDHTAWCPLALRWLGLFRGRVVVYLHGAELRLLRTQWRVFHWLVVAAFRTADVVVAPSAELRDEAVQVRPAVAGRLRLIPNGIDVAAVRRQAPRREKRPYVLFAGRLDRVKNLPVLITAYASVVSRLPGVDLLLAGEGGEEGRLRAEVQRLGLEDRVRFLGSVERPEVWALMRGAELLVLPSLAEGNPIVVLEAFAAGRMVLGSDVKGIRGLVVDGESGALFPRDDPEALGRLLVRYVDPGARGAVEAAIRTMDVRGFDIHHQLAQHLAVLAGGQAGAASPRGPEGEDHAVRDTES